MKKLILTLAVLVSLLTPASATAAQQKLTMREVRHISSVLAREWSEHGHYKLTHCWLKGRPGPEDPEAPPGDAGCEALIPTISYRGAPHQIPWEDGTIVTLMHHRLCAEWEGPTKGRVCERH